MSVKYQLFSMNAYIDGVIINDFVRLGKCIKELERIHGIRHGNNQHGERIGNGFQSSLTQEDLAKELDQEAIGYAANYEATCYRINPDGTREMIYKPGDDDQNGEKPGRVGNYPKEGNGATWNQ